jgi:hypothetical protein
MEGVDEPEKLSARASRTQAKRERMCRIPLTLLLTTESFKALPLAVGAVSVPADGAGAGDGGVSSNGGASADILLRRNSVCSEEANLGSEWMREADSLEVKAGSWIKWVLIMSSRRW